MNTNPIHAQVYRDGVIQIVLVQQRKGRVVVGVEIDDLLSAVLQSDFGHQVVRKMNPASEFRVYVGCNAIRRVEMDGPPARYTSIGRCNDSRSSSCLNNLRRPSANAVRVWNT
jgi:hypothetical protein